jgi:DNA repair protein RadC
MQLQLKSPPTYTPSKLKSLPLRDQPAYRVSSNAAASSLAELLAALVGGVKQIEIAESILACFGGDVQRINKAHVAELASIQGVGQQTAVRIKATLSLGIRLHEPAGERAVINSPADTAALVQYEMPLLEQEYLKVMR